MKHIVSRMSSYFPNRWPLSYLYLTKNMKTYIRRQQHKIFFKHQDIKRKEPPQKYRLGTISNTKLLAGLNRFYMAITSPSASAVVLHGHNLTLSFCYLSVLTYFIAFFMYNGVRLQVLSTLGSARPLQHNNTACMANIFTGTTTYT